MDSQAEHLIDRVFEESHWWISAGVALFILHTRNLHAVYFGAGITASALAAKVAKILLRQPRPEYSTFKRKTSYGMPSTHSAAMSFIGVYCALALSSLSISDAKRLVLQACVLAATLVLTHSRVRLGYHSNAQVLGGWVLGVVFSYIWWRVGRRLQV